MFGTMSIREVLDDDLASLVLADDQLLDRGNDEIEVPHDPRFNMSQRMEIFRERAALAYLDVLRALCQNRCRTRRALRHTIADWDNLQLDAEELDVELRQFTGEKPIVDPSYSRTPVYSFPLSSWAYYHKLRQMEWIVQIGFELEVYQPDELAGMYWYLTHLTQTRVRHLERIRTFVGKRLAAAKRNNPASTFKESEFGRSLSFINFSMLEATANQGFADALNCLYVALGRLSIFSSPSHPYSDDKTRYELRMKPFLQIGLPELIPYDRFNLSVTQPSETTADLLKIATEAAARARKDFELMSKLNAKTAHCLGSEESWKNNVKDCLKACISASITISMVKKAVDAAGAQGEVKLKGVIPEAGKGYHDFWVVPKISPV